jgi:hypothetical protein
VADGMTNLAHRQLRAPQEDSTALIDPPLSAIPAMVAASRAVAAGWRVDLPGTNLRELTAHARSEAFQAAMGYSCEYVDCGFLPPLTPERPFLLAGHQPELFHAGVWFKNFLLSSLAAHQGAVPINLIVDSDAVHRTSIAVPTTTSRGAATESMAFDEAAEQIPFEERPLLDVRQFHAFGDRVRSAIDAVSGQRHGTSLPLVTPFWQAARAAERRHLARPMLGRVLAEARHALEMHYNLRTLELPLSHVCRGQPFQAFALHLLWELPRLVRDYNEALAAYRALNHVRSESHPAPSLETRGEWLEAPLRLWTTEQPLRRRPFVRRTAQGLEISDFAGIRLLLTMSDDAPEEALLQLAVAEQAGIKLRPRALITTMYARLVLSDLFIHGIGGAKYDELTDEIIRRFFGIEPPAYLTATATFRLPIERPHVTAEDVRDSARRIRDLRFRPESFLGDPLLAREPAMQRELQALADEKREYLRTHTLRGATREVYAGLDRINRAMHQRLAPVEAHLRAEHARLSDEAQRSRLLGSREFSFVLFPEEYLVPRLLELSKVPA